MGDKKKKKIERNYNVLGEESKLEKDCILLEEKINKIGTTLFGSEDKY